MARFLFLSWCTWGHIDLGGMGFFRTGKELVRRGHNVHWLFTDTLPQSKITDFMVKAGIQIVDAPAKKLVMSGINQDGNRVAWSINKVVEIARRGNFDVLVAERTIALSGLAAAHAGIPYASIGTNGSIWRRGQTDSGLPFIIHGESSNFVNGALWSWAGLEKDFAPGLGSDWLVSPYLNIAFFPEQFYASLPGIHAPYPCHYVGCEVADRPAVKRDCIVLALGNTFHRESVPLVCDQINRLCHYESVMKNIDKIVILTGNQSQTEALQQKYGDSTRLEFRTWDNYGEVFSHAKLAIGHGGNAFTWECIRSGVPAVIISPHVSDQIFNAGRLQSLGVARIVERNELNADAFQDAVCHTMISSAVNAAIGKLQQLMFSGGGVTASVALLGRLATKKAPIWECVADVCCAGQKVNKIG